MTCVPTGSPTPISCVSSASLSEAARSARLLVRALGPGLMLALPAAVLLAGPLDPRAVVGLLVGVAGGGRGRFVVGLAGPRVLRQRRPGGGQRQDKPRDSKPF